MGPLNALFLIIAHVGRRQRRTVIPDTGTPSYSVSTGKVYEKFEEYELCRYIQLLIFKGRTATDKINVTNFQFQLKNNQMIVETEQNIFFLGTECLPSKCYIELISALNLTIT